MSQINPFIGSMLQTPNAQRQTAADRDKLLRRTADSAKNAYLTEDRVELSVESADLAEKPGDQQKQKQQREKKEKPDEDLSEETGERLDLKA